MVGGSLTLPLSENGSREPVTRAPVGMRSPRPASAPRSPVRFRAGGGPRGPGAKGAASRTSTKTSGWRSIFDTRWIDRESRQRFDTPGDRSFLMSLEGGLRSQLEEERKLGEALEDATQEEKEQQQAAVCRAEETARARLRGSIERGKAYLQPLMPGVQQAREEAHQAARRVEAAKSRNSALSRTMEALGRKPGAPRGLEKARRAAQEGQRRAEARLHAAGAAGFAEQAQALHDIEAYLKLRQRDLEGEIAVLREEEEERQRQEEEERKERENKVAASSPTRSLARSHSHAARVRRLLKRKHGVSDGGESEEEEAPIDVSEYVDAADIALRVPPTSVVAPRGLCALPVNTNPTVVPLASIDSSPEDWEARRPAEEDWQEFIALSRRGRLGRWSVGRRSCAPVADLRCATECCTLLGGRQLAVGDHSGRVHLVDAVSGKLAPGLTPSWQVSRGAVTALRPHPSNYGVVAAATSSGDCAVRVLDVMRRRQLRVLHGHEGRVTDVDWVSAGGAQASLLASVGTDTTLRLWRAKASGGDSCAATLVGHEAVVRCVRYTPTPGSSTLLCSGGDDGAVMVWDAGDPGLAGPTATLQGHTAPVTDVTPLRGSGVESCVASASFDRTIRVWDLRVNDYVATLSDHGGFVHQVVALDETGTGRPRIASAANDGTVKVWDLRNVVAAAARRQELESKFTFMGP